MPKCLHDKGKDVVDCYRLFYSGHKVQVTKLRWEPCVENPYFLDDCKARISIMPDVLEDIQATIATIAKKPSKKKIKIGN